MANHVLFLLKTLIHANQNLDAINPTLITCLFRFQRLVYLVCFYLIPLTEYFANKHLCYIHSTKLAQSLELFHSAANHYTSRIKSVLPRNPTILHSQTPNVFRISVATNITTGFCSSPCEGEKRLNPKTTMTLLLAGSRPIRFD